MRAHAIRAMQRKMFLKLRQPQEALECRTLHLLYVAKLHVMVNQRDDLRRLLVREAEPPQNHLRNSHPHLNVPAEPDAISRPGRLERRRLADIVQQHPPCQCC